MGGFCCQFRTLYLSLRVRLCILTLPRIPRKNPETGGSDIPDPREETGHKRRDGDGEYMGTKGVKVRRYEETL